MYKIQKTQPDLLSNFDIEDICGMIGVPLHGVYSKDELTDIEPLIGCYVVNLEDSTEGGSHWVAVVINESYVSYFDSFAVRPSDDVKEFISRYVKNQDIQTGLSWSCNDYGIPWNIRVRFTCVSDSAMSLSPI